MNGEEARQVLIGCLLEKADLALSAAQREFNAGDYGLAMNRVYYACFYAASAVLTHENLQYARHSGVRAALHQHLVKAGRLTAELGRFYNDAFDDRQEADYDVIVEFDSETVRSRIVTATQFVTQMKLILKT